RTMPKFLTIRYPGISRPDVTIPKSTRGIFALLKETFTGAILTVQTSLCEQSSSVILGRRGDPLLHLGILADPAWGVPHLAGCAMAGLRATAPAFRSRLLCAACSCAVPLQRHRAG